MNEPMQNLKTLASHSVDQYGFEMSYKPERMINARLLFPIPLAKSTQQSEYVCEMIISAQLEGKNKYSSNERSHSSV